MKTILFVILIAFASCSSGDDPKPQISCAELKAEIDLASKAITEHYAKGSGGDPVAWEKELTRLNQIKTEKVNEYTTRACPK